MPFDPLLSAASATAWRALTTLEASDGTAAHPAPARLRDSAAPLRDLSDTVHLICMLHGRHPGVIDHAIGHVRNDAVRAWLDMAAEAFAAERGFIVRLVAAAGPLPSTPGQAETEAAVAAQRHALDMLAQSDREGCAAGAAIALALDWVEIRSVLDAAAQRLSVDVPPCGLPPVADTAMVVEALADRLPVERAMMFGAQQILAQHRGLWDLLEARASARNRW